MPFIERNEGAVAGLYRQCQYPGQEFLPDDDAEVIDYLTPKYSDLRRKSMSNGGYGTWREQLEMINEQGFGVWHSHCSSVKTNIPKT